MASNLLDLEDINPIELMKVVRQRAGRPDAPFDFLCMVQAYPDLKQEQQALFDEIIDALTGVGSLRGLLDLVLEDSTDEDEYANEFEDL